MPIEKVRLSVGSITDVEEIFQGWRRTAYPSSVIKGHDGGTVPNVLTFLSDRQKIGSIKMQECVFGRESWWVRGVALVRWSNASVNRVVEDISHTNHVPGNNHW